MYLVVLSKVHRLISSKMASSSATTGARSAALSWQELQQRVSLLKPRLALGEGLKDREQLKQLRIEGSTNAQATLRLFGRPEREVRVTLFRDHHAWCPYCQKIWLYLEESKIPYRIRKVTMFCYGEKERWYKKIVPSGMLPALQLDHSIITESDVILHHLEQTFGPLGTQGQGLEHPLVYPLRQLERRLFRVWCDWLCSTEGSGSRNQQAKAAFIRVANEVETALSANPHNSSSSSDNEHPFFLGAGDELGTADIIFIPYLERMAASLAYYKGYNIRESHPKIHQWFVALEKRDTYLGTQSDYHTHAHDLPPQMGSCLFSGTSEQRLVASAVDNGTAAIDNSNANNAVVALLKYETSQEEPGDGSASQEALARVIRHRKRISDINLPSHQKGAGDFDETLRAALTNLVHLSERDVPTTGASAGAGVAISALCCPPAGSSQSLRYLRDRISVPRDMSVYAARRLRTALELTATLAPNDAESGSSSTGDGAFAIPVRHRRDQDPVPFTSS